MEVTTEMYTKLFNGITDAEKKLEEVVEMLKKTQAEAEELYIEK